jgi:hypothetical protein
VNSRRASTLSLDGAAAPAAPLSPAATLPSAVHLTAPAFSVFHSVATWWLASTVRRRFASAAAVQRYKDRIKGATGRPTRTENTQRTNRTQRTNQLSQGHENQQHSKVPRTRATHTDTTNKHAQRQLDAPAGRTRRTKHHTAHRQGAAAHPAHRQGPLQEPGQW